MVCWEPSTASFRDISGLLPGMAEQSLRSLLDFHVASVVPRIRIRLTVATWDGLSRTGTRVVVSGFETSREGTSVVSRSGKGVIMIPNQGGFRVDPAFAGNEQSNLLTRAALSNIDKIETMLVEEVMRIFE